MLGFIRIKLGLRVNLCEVDLGMVDSALRESCIAPANFLVDERSNHRARISFLPIPSNGGFIALRGILIPNNLSGRISFLFCGLVESATLYTATVNKGENRRLILNRSSWRRVP